MFYIVCVLHVYANRSTCDRLRTQAALLNGLSLFFLLQLYFDSVDDCEDTDLEVYTTDDTSCDMYETGVGLIVLVAASASAPRSPLSLWSRSSPQRTDARRARAWA